MGSSVKEESGCAIVLVLIVWIAFGLEVAIALLFLWVYGRLIRAKGAPILRKYVDKEE